MKKRNLVAMLLCFAMVLSMLPAALAAEGPFSGGTGTAADPYVISTAEQLAAFATAVDSGTSYEGQYVALGADIDLSTTAKWNPIGAENGAANLFNGTFDGKGHTISGLTVSGTYNAEANVGLFSTLGAAAEVKELTLKGANVSVQTAEGAKPRTRAGILAGDTAAGATVIDGVNVKGTVSVTSTGVMAMAGGVVGRMSRGASLVNSTADVTVTSNVTDDIGFWGYAGGLTAMTGNGCVIANNAVKGTVSGTAYQGGVAGMLTGGLYNVYTDVTLSGTAEKSGAVAGQTMASGDHVYYTGSKDAFGTVTMGEVQAEAITAADSTLAAKLNDNRAKASEAAGKTLNGWELSGGAVLPTQQYEIVVMNIPYDVFYNQVAGVKDKVQYDAVTSATTKKASYFWDGSAKGNTPVAYGQDATLKGVQFPVELSKADAAKLKAENSASAYYIYGAAEAPAIYTAATVSSDGQVSFEQLSGEPAVLADATVALSTDSKHGQYMLTIGNDGGVLTEADKASFQVYGAVLTADNGKSYGLYHLFNLYYKDFHEIAFNTTADTTGKDQDKWAEYKDYFASLAGQKITGITYYTNEGIYSIKTEVAVPESGYVLMNIPYADFYAAEGVSGVDAVSTATVKTYNQTMAAGSYHDGYTAPEDLSKAKILGVTYPVYVEDLSALKDKTEVKADSAATISVAEGKSALTTKDVTGKDVLFASGDYAYYVLDGEPANYKTLTVSDGKFSFSAVKNAAVAAKSMEANVTYGGHYTDITLTVSSEEIGGATAVNAIILTAKDAGGTETKYAIRHVEDVWRMTQLGWNWDGLDGKGLAGKTISNITYYISTEDGYGVYSYDTNVTIKNQPPAVTAEFTEASSLKLTGLPEDIANPAATVKTQVGRGETATVIAENVKVADNAIATTSAAENGKSYVVTIVSDNYGDISATAVYEAKEEPPKPAEEPTKPTEEPAKPSEEPAKPTEEPAPVKTQFVDVEKGSYYEEAVNWAVEQGITDGTSDTTFSPGDGCTRGQVVTFLWRAAGKPAVTNNTNPFADVVKGEYYYDAVLWAVEKGITDGTSDTTFEPNATCTRGQIVTFLNRYEGKPALTGSRNPFVDVPADAYYYNAVLWAVEKGITDGTSDTTFEPNATCTRAQIVTFLFRDKG